MKNVRIQFVIRMSLLLIFASTEINADESVEYYEKLIESYTESTKSYKVLTSSDYFITKDTKDDSPKDFGTYDFIIVGGGSAGSVVASRLSECKGDSVLLLEAGTDENDYSDIPSMTLHLQLTDFNWGYKTTKQTTCCLGMKDEQCNYPRGKVLGGTSTINAIMYARGNAKDYDYWSSLGNDGWSYKEVLPYFKKSERCQIDNADPGYHGKNGYLNVEYDNPDSPLMDAYLQSNRLLGRKVLDYNGVQQLGVSRTQVNTRNGRRQSGHKAFITNIMNRKNLHVLTKALVLKVLIEGRRSVGVKFNHNGTVKYTVKANKEVVLTAGAVNTPQLLMLSGIGCKDELEKIKIPVIKDLPGVGKNLQDHATFFGLVFTTNYSEPVLPMSEYIKQYLKGKGPFTFASNSQGVGYVQTSTLLVPGLPDVEWIFIPPNNTADITPRVWNLKEATWEKYYKKANPVSSFTVYNILLHPKSRGSVFLTSNSPYQYPSVDVRFLSDPDDSDIKTIYEGVKRAIEFTKQEPFLKYNTKLLSVPVPGCENMTYLSDDYWYCAIRHICNHMYHIIGTAKMGPSSDKMAVVDNKGCVYGIDSLRVADVSIAPNHVAGHTNAVAYMIGEKISDEIKRKYRHKSLFHIFKKNKC